MESSEEEKVYVGGGGSAPHVGIKEQPTKSEEKEITKKQKTWLIIGGAIVFTIFASAIIYSFMNLDKW